MEFLKKIQPYKSIRVAGIVAKHQKYCIATGYPKIWAATPDNCLVLKAAAVTFSRSQLLWE